jgi:predicted DNA-binding transcriptional regulator AlpA
MKSKHSPSTPPRLSGRIYSTQVATPTQEAMRPDRNQERSNDVKLTPNGYDPALLHDLETLLRRRNSPIPSSHETLLTCFLTISEVCSLLRFSRSTYSRRIKPTNPCYDKRFPIPHRLHENQSGRGRVGILVADFLEYVQQTDPRFQGGCTTLKLRQT